MAIIKSFTSLEQSKKLAEILPLESADMMYQEYETVIGDDYGYTYRLQTYNDENMEGISCWSLASLLGIIPNYKLSSEHNYHTCTAETSFGKETVGWFDNPIDACVAMIEKLNELNML